MFDVNYLGGHMPTFSLNFSRPGSEVIAQYFMFMSLGRTGFTTMMRNLQYIAKHIVGRRGRPGPLPTGVRRDRAAGFRLRRRPEIKNYNVFDVSDRLRQRGWLVPAYTFPANRQDLSVLRIVVRAGMHIEMGDKLLDFLGEQTAALQSLTAPLPRPVSQHRSAFAH